MTAGPPNTVRSGRARSRASNTTSSPHRNQGEEKESAMADAKGNTEQAVFKVMINGPIEAVWREITRTDKPQKCMFNMRLHTPGLKPGAPIRMRTTSGKYTGVIGEVLEFDPPRKYSHTFKFTNFDDPPCTVTYELREASPRATEFTL